MSEIEDIFAAKGRSVNQQKLSPSVPNSPKDKKKKRDGAKPKSKEHAARDTTPTAPSEQKKTTKRPAPETIVDPSSASSAPAQKKQKTESPRHSKTTKPQKPKKPSKSEGDDRFADSRGTGPRKKTEEGWAVYKEDELGISNEGGDTPLCPFDCECCY
ncbi:DUF1764-domain-containing protein [Pluteus cervinus]|uniref:DUF1764-domain-containing protein n=1 Tax=Pluteus cervinus TaxID=181527 RepID=A0ACD3BFR5_9AGAR|nr:DUF1764-domain-containing protein [Pluteus cervinus]